jgi:hypothetical protein
MSNLIIRIVDLRLIDLNDEGRFLQLEHEERIKIKNKAFGFLPNGDLIIVSLNDELKEYKIYSYSFKNKPATNTTLWKCSQIYDIEFPESLKDEKINCIVYQTKLFLIYGNQLITQWNLSTMTFDIQYFTDGIDNHYTHVIVVNKNQTLLALGSEYKVDVFSMETGTRISSCGWYYLYSYCV